MYILVVTLSAENYNKLLEQLTKGLKRTIKWNKYLNYLIDLPFTKVNRLFLFSLENENDSAPFSKYYIPKVEIKNFNVLIDGKQFFEIAVKNKEKAYEQIIEMSKNNDYVTGKFTGL